MHAVVSLLDEEHNQRVEAVWAEMESIFGVRGVYETPFPHFSYQIGAEYDLKKTERILRRLSLRTAPFRVRTTGLGIFTGIRPVLFVAVVRDPALTRFQQKVWKQVSAAGTGVVDYYQPDHWMPHITIGFGDLHKDNVCQMVRVLSERNFTWDIEIDNVALIYDEGGRQGLKFRFALQGETKTQQ